MLSRKRHLGVPCFSFVELDMPSIASTELLTPSELASRLSVSTKTLANWRVRGEGPKFKKIGASVRYDARAVAEWERAREFSSTTQAQHGRVS